MLYYCYIIQSQTSSKYYIGVTDGIPRRVEQHNNGISKWTENRGPWVLVWHKEFKDLSEARKFENKLKRQKGGDGFYTITGLEKQGS